MKHEANQHEVWDSVTNFSLKLNVQSNTMNLSDIYDNKKDEFDEYVSKFKHNSEANGVAVFVGGKLLSTDLFNRTDVYTEYFPKIIRGVTMETYYMKEKKKLDEAEAKYVTLNFFDELEKTDYQIVEGAGIGTEKRYESDKHTGFELRYEGHLIHLAGINMEKSKKRDEFRGR